MTLEQELQVRGNDRWLLAKVRTHLHFERHSTFTSDDFRAWGLDEYLHGDKQGAIGGWFARMKHSKDIVEVGYTRSDRKSNKQRLIRTWKPKEV